MSHTSEAVAALLGFGAGEIAQVVILALGLVIIAGVEGCDAVSSSMNAESHSDPDMPRRLRKEGVVRLETHGGCSAWLVEWPCRRAP